VVDQLKEPVAHPGNVALGAEVVEYQQRRAADVLEDFEEAGARIALHGVAQEVEEVRHDQE
jgi:hypothetical protein